MVLFDVKFVDWSLSLRFPKGLHVTEWFTQHALMCLTSVQLWILFKLQWFVWGYSGFSTTWYGLLSKLVTQLTKLVACWTEASLGGPVYQADIFHWTLAPIVHLTFSFRHRKFCMIRMRMPSSELTFVNGVNISLKARTSRCLLEL